MQRNPGFTLLEVLITIVIIAILASIALPAYNSYVVRGKIQEATTNMLALRTKMEQFYQDNRQYTTNGTNVSPCDTPSLATLNTSLKYFTISCPTLTTDSYVIQASGVAGLSGLVYQINTANVRTTVSVPSGWTMPTTNCWVTKTNGSC